VEVKRHVRRVCAATSRLSGPHDVSVADVAIVRQNGCYGLNPIVPDTLVWLWSPPWQSLKWNATLASGRLQKSSRCSHIGFNPPLMTATSNSAQTVVASFCFSASSYSSDQYGAIHKAASHANTTIREIRSKTGRGDNELALKSGLSLIDEIDVIRVFNDRERRQVIAHFKAAKITRLSDGRRVEDIVLMEGQSFDEADRNYEAYSFEEKGQAETIRTPLVPRVSYRRRLRSGRPRRPRKGSSRCYLAHRLST